VGSLRRPNSLKAGFIASSNLAVAVINQQGRNGGTGRHRSNREITAARRCLQVRFLLRPSALLNNAEKDFLQTAV